jgi:hypothetical protein
MGQEGPVRLEPFFIVGMQRSGTTMLRLMLNAHRSLAVPFESGFISWVYKDLPHSDGLGSDSYLPKAVSCSKWLP